MKPATVLQLDAPLTRRSVVDLLGQTRTATYTSHPGDSVCAVPDGPEWGAKPDIVSSGRLLQLCEGPCMDAIRAVMTPAECSLGRRAHLEHHAPAAIGDTLTITARCVRAAGRFSAWVVTVTDAVETVGVGCMEFAVVDRVQYDTTRVAPKRP
jgi:fluoroacetyl-CoA thioesterase